MQTARSPPATLPYHLKTRHLSPISLTAASFGASPHHIITRIPRPLASQLDVVGYFDREINTIFFKSGVP